MGPRYGPIDFIGPEDENLWWKFNEEKFAYVPMTSEEASKAEKECASAGCRQCRQNTKKVN
jgi:hypothetical protein